MKMQMEGSEIRAALEAERSAALVRVQAMRSDLEGIILDSVDMNADDEHDPEGSTIAYERARINALMDEAQTKLADLDRALAKLDAGSYSECEECGIRIPVERLVALPATRMCFDCALARRSG
jgi:DnaK suppressor protein